MSLGGLRGYHDGEESAATRGGEVMYIGAGAILLILLIVLIILFL